MSYELHVRQNQLIHTGLFSRPLFDLWGDGKTILRGLFEAFSPFGTTLPDIRVEPGLVSPADQVITVNVGLVGLHRFKFDRVESTFFNFSDDVFPKIAGIIEASTKWIRSAVSSFEFASHQFVYSSHCQVANSTVRDLLGSIYNRSVESGGLDLGTGLILHWEVPEHNWRTQLVLDRSLIVTDGLYIMFTLLAPGKVSDFPTLARAGRTYLEAVLSDLGINFGEPSI